jgi:hypothetical protein
MRTALPNLVKSMSANPFFVRKYDVNIQARIGKKTRANSRTAGMQSETLKRLAGHKHKTIQESDFSEKIGLKNILYETKKDVQR